jgi:hypothetical protein
MSAGDGSTPVASSQARLIKVTSEARRRRRDVEVAQLLDDEPIDQRVLRHLIEHGLGNVVGKCRRDACGGEAREEGDGHLRHQRRWIAGLNNGDTAGVGYRQATERLDDYGSTMAGLATTTAARARRAYATGELTDGATIAAIHGIERFVPTPATSSV